MERKEEKQNFANISAKSNFGVTSQSKLKITISRSRKGDTAMISEVPFSFSKDQTNHANESYLNRRRKAGGGDSRFPLLSISQGAA